MNYQPETSTSRADWALLLGNLLLLAGVVVVYSHVGGSALSGRIDGARYLVWADGQYRAVAPNAYLESFFVESLWAAMTGWLLVRCVRRSFPSGRKTVPADRRPPLVAATGDGPSGDMMLLSIRSVRPERFFSHYEPEKHSLRRAARHARRRRPTSRSDCGDSHARTRRARIGGLRT